MAEALDSAPPTASSRRRISPLRLRLLALVAIAFFPLFLLVVRLASDERNATTLRERDASLRLLDVAIAEHRDLTHTALELLRHVAAAEIASGDSATCSRSLRELLATYANFTNVARISTFLQERLTGMSVVQLFNREESELREFKSINRDFRKANLDAVFYNAVFFPAVDIIVAAGIALIIWYGGGQVLAGVVTLGTVIAFVVAACGVIVTQRVALGPAAIVGETHLVQDQTSDRSIVPR